MIERIVGAGQRFRLLILPIAAAAMLVGAIQLPSARVDVLPEFAAPTVRIQTEALGLSAAEVEQLVTVPLEQNLLVGVAWLDEIRSESMTGLSSIELVFQPGTPVLDARQMVQERLTHAHTLPNVSKLPVMLQPVSSSNRVLMVEMSSTSVSMIDQSVLARWRIKPRLLGIPGVANVSIWGQRERQLQVQVDPVKLKAAGVSLSQVTETTANSLWVSPLTYVEASTPGSGGFIDGPNQRLGIRHVLPITDASDLAKVIVDGTAGTNPLRLGDVADVVEDHQPLIGDAVVDSGRGLTLVIEKFPDANAREVSRMVEEALGSMAVGLPGITVDTKTFQPASFIDTALDNLTVALLVGLAMLLIVLFLLTLGWRSVLIGLLSATVSLALGVFALQWLGVTFNGLILAGLVIALGVIIDDAVVGVDHIVRRLRAREEGAEALTVMREALSRVWVPLAFATVAIAATAVPLLLFNGLAGEFLAPMATAYLLAVAVSAIVALTVTPALAAVLLAKTPVAQREPAVRRWLAGVTDRVATVPRLAFGLLALLVIGGAVAAPALSAGGLMPALQDRDLLVNWGTVAGTSRGEFVRLTDKVTGELRAIEGVRGVGAHIGRAVTGDEVTDVHSGQLWVSIAPDADYERTVAAVRESIGGYPGTSSQIRGYHNDILNNAQPGAVGTLTVRVYGNDADVLRTKANEIQGLLAKTGGIAQARVNQEIAAPTVQIKVDLAKAQDHGLKPGDVRRQAATLVSGVEVGNIFEEQKVFDVIVIGVADLRHSLSAAQDLLIDKPDGTQVRLGDVAEVKITTNPNVIRHDAVSRYLDVTADLDGASVDDVHAQIKTVTFPSEHHAEILGATPDQANDWLYMLIIFGVAGIAVFLLLQAGFSSWGRAGIGFLTLLGSLSGAIAAAAVFGVTATVALLGGILAVAALALRWLFLQDRTPVVVTGLGFALVLLPMIVLGAVPGYETIRPLAIVAIGGLITTILVNLLVVPALVAPQQEEREISHA
uniref:Cobalt-zinc-cadmium resistance protein CzcA n=1 Tax=uncultured bacterium esnapd14 TaxID=1366594 RepID=S5UBJ5_9BACT|nr:cobalt-zinc-cadmium resistance protein CzcA [uncultured bacterium esnapd14]